MKRIIYLLLTAMLLSAMPYVSYAQSNDPFEQETLKANGNNTQKEKKVDRKKAEEPKKQAVPVATQEPIKKQDAPAPKDAMTISNPCSEWLDFEFVSLVGSTGTQTATMTCKVTNHKTNKSMYLGGMVLAYDTEGDEHYGSSVGSRYDCLTDVPVKFSFEIPGKMVPSKVSKFNVITFNVGDCHIEMRNVPIEWK